MFDINSTAHLVALRDEVLSDPLGIGYNLDSTSDILNGLNDGTRNPTPGLVAENLTVAKVLSSIVPSEMDASRMGEGDRLFLDLLLRREFSENIDNYRTKILDLFGQGSSTVSNINAMARPSSRAEDLWGAGTHITRAQWLAARDYVEV